ncbi:hypothetical protein GGU11DRAFT_761151 [Lentinula aff. detonsa]|nr:hypothetical protein GGU11DRAFT_761151 [Lentinula aff. detonsa]
MSSTSSPTRPVRSLPPVNNEEEAELQVFLVATKRKAQEKWEKLQGVKASGVVGTVVGGEDEIIKAKEVVVKDQDNIVEVDEEVIPKVESRPRKVVTKMVAGLPRGCKVILIILIPKKRCTAVDPEVVELSRKRQKVQYPRYAAWSVSSPFKIEVASTKDRQGRMGLEKEIEKSSMILGSY